MTNKKIYPKGLRAFKPHKNAPDFVKGTLIVTPRDLIDFCRENGNLLTDYKEVKQLKCQILEGNEGLYFVVDTWKPEKKEQSKDQEVDDFNDVDDLPF